MNDNINISAATEADLIVAPVVQNLPAIQLVIQGPVVQGEDPAVGIGPVDAQPVPIVLGPVDIQPAPVVQGPVNAPVRIVRCKVYVLIRGNVLIQCPQVLLAIPSTTFFYSPS